jgi:16S rRNA (cytidine1402-2'-O)-methyltransferase
MNSGTLYIVATPIGNLEDMTFRAIRVLGEVDCIAAEDTRHSRKLLTHFGIAKPLTSYFDHNKNLKGAAIIAKLQAGQSVALISDAGTPCISDPGYQLVRDAVAAGIQVVPIPGACAAITALSASGLPTDSFVFQGFLPNRSGKRRERLASLRAEDRVLIFYEAPTRIVATLTDMLELFGDRDIVLGREITKVFEEFLRGTIAQVLQNLAERTLKGEFVVMVGHPEKQVYVHAEQDLEELLARYLFEDGYSVKDAARVVAEETGVAKGKAYELALRIKG